VHPPFLEELDLYNLLCCLRDRGGELDPLVRHGLVKKGLIVDDTPPRLTRFGLQEPERLREHLAQGGVAPGDA